MICRKYNELIIIFQYTVLTVESVYLLWLRMYVRISPPNFFCLTLSFMLECNLILFVNFSVDSIEVWEDVFLDGGIVYSGVDNRLIISLIVEYLVSEPCNFLFLAFLYLYEIIHMSMLVRMGERIQSSRHQSISR